MSNKLQEAVSRLFSLNLILNKALFLLPMLTCKFFDWQNLWSSVHLLYPILEHGLFTLAEKVEVPD